MIKRIALFLLLTAPLLGADSPLRLSIDPNALENASAKFTVTIGDIAPGETIRWRVYRDCNNDGKLDKGKIGSCTSLVDSGIMKAEKSPYKLELQVADLREKAGAPPLEDFAVLWFTAYRQEPGVKDQWLQFGLSGKQPCSWLKEIFSAFLPGRDCGPALGTSLRAMDRDLTGLTDITFEIRRLEPVADAEPQTLPKSQGVTGMTWLDAKHMLVTVAPVLDSYRDALAPGLYKLPVEGGEPQRLWAPPEETAWYLSAPLALPRRTVAFVRRPILENKTPDTQPDRRLVFWRKGKLTGETIPLNLPVYRLLAWDKKTRSLLALTLGEKDAQPGFLRIDRKTGAVTHLVYSETFYRAFMGSPAGDQTATARFDVSGLYGWHLLGFDSRGKMFPLVRREEHDLMPLWGPDGAHLYYLAEIGRIEPY